MSEITTIAHRCHHCRAPLELKKEREGVVRCLYCGADHRLSNSKADEERRLHQERNLGGFVAPYVWAPLIGFFAFVAYRDFLWSIYQGYPAMIVGVLFLLVGTMSFRMPAVLGLAIVGLAGVLKPFVRPIANGSYSGWASPTSETAFYYLVPGVVSLIVAYLFFASLKVRELKPALKALLPRITVVAVFVAGAYGAFSYIGASLAGIIADQKDTIASYERLAREACTGKLLQELDTVIEKMPRRVDSDRFKKNTITIACGELSEWEREEGDPLLIDELSELRDQIWDSPVGHTGMRETTKDILRSRTNAQYLYVILSGSKKHTGMIISIRSKSIIRGAQVGFDFSGTYSCRAVVRVPYCSPIGRESGHLCYLISRIQRSRSESLRTTRTDTWSPKRCCGVSPNSSKEPSLLGLRRVGERFKYTLTSIGGSSKRM